MYVAPIATFQAPATRAASSAICAGSYCAIPAMCSGGTAIPPEIVDADHDVEPPDELPAERRPEAVGAEVVARADDRRVARDERVLDERAHAAGGVGRHGDRAGQRGERGEAAPHPDAAADRRADRGLYGDGLGAVRDRELRRLRVEDAPADHHVERREEAEADRHAVRERAAERDRRRGADHAAAQGRVREPPVARAQVEDRAREPQGQPALARQRQERRVRVDGLVPLGDGGAGRAHGARARAEAEHVLGRRQGRARRREGEPCREEGREPAPHPTDPAEHARATVDGAAPAR
ncbi:hypothetical protein [Sorangium sp. So ce854]|uniref:hypothetical protein n=1 Tax=Sorangium sp. So ce854 TaxID=3133322 RepID=UPI003F5F10EB